MERPFRAYNLLAEGAGNTKSSLRSVDYPVINCDCLDVVSSPEEEKVYVHSRAMLYSVSIQSSLPYLSLKKQVVLSPLPSLPKDVLLLQHGGMQNSKLKPEDFRHKTAIRGEAKANGIHTVPLVPDSSPTRGRLTIRISIRKT